MVKGRSLQKKERRFFPGALETQDFGAPFIWETGPEWRGGDRDNEHLSSHHPLEDQRIILQRK